MTDRMLFLGWGQVVRGREERALEVFNESMDLYGRMEHDGRIARFDVALLEPHAGELAGYIALHGSATQLSAVRHDEEFRRLQVDVSLIVDDLRVIDGFDGPGVAEQMTMYADAVTKVAAHA
jgi:hypothetical protein